MRGGGLRLSTRMVNNLASRVTRTLLLNQAKLLRSRLVQHYSETGRGHEKIVRVNSTWITRFCREWGLAQRVITVQYKVRT